MILRSLFLAPIVLLLFLATSTSATQNQSQAVKFDEFNDILHSDLIARLDNFAVQLQQSPKAKGFVIVYRSKRDLPGLSHSMALVIRDYLVSTRGLTKDRVVTVDGGVATYLVQELWIVPSGTAPKPREDAKIGYFYRPDFAWKFFQYNYLPPELYKRFGVQKPLDSDEDYLEAFATEIKKQPATTACIIVYAQYDPKPKLVDYVGNYEPRREVRLDLAGTARRRLLHEKTVLTKTYGIPPARIRTIDGGYRKDRLVELWVVPAGEPMPIPTPNSFPKSKGP
jgi:hypothetical protein